MEPEGRPADDHTVAALHHELLSDLAGPGDWWDGASRRALMEETRAARGCTRCRDEDGSPPTVLHPATASLPASAVEVVHRVVNNSGRLTRSWAQMRIDELGDAQYAEVVGVTAIVVAIDVYATSAGERPPTLLAPIDGPVAAGRPDGVGDVGAWIPMTTHKALANVSRALSVVPRTNATWRALVTDSYSRGAEMLELRWQRALTRPQVELVASQVSRMQECFY